MEDPFDPTVTVAAVATNVEQLPEEYRKAFRRAVEEALQYVFRMDASKAFERSRLYFEAENPPGLFAYHRHVLQIASDLSDAADEPLQGDRKDRYLEFARAQTDAFGLPRKKPTDDGEGRRAMPAW